MGYNSVKVGDILQTNYELNLKKRLLEEEREYENRLQRLEFLNKHIEDILLKHQEIAEKFNNLTNNEDINTITRFVKLTKMFGTIDIGGSLFGDPHTKELVEMFKSFPRYKTMLELDEELTEYQKIIDETKKSIINTKKELCSTNHILVQNNNNFVCKKCNLIYDNNDYHHLCGRVLVYSSIEKKPRNLVLSEVYHQFYNEKDEEKYSQEFMDIVINGIKEDKDVYAIRKIIRKKYFRRK